MDESSMLNKKFEQYKKRKKKTKISLGKEVV